MATTLKKTNVVIIGLGAAGGVACLPLAQAGLEVIGLEAGSWLSTKDMAPDELKLSRGLWPPGPQKTKLEGVTVRANASAPAIRLPHPMMNAVGGTSIHYWAQSWRLNPWDFKVRSETIRRYGVSRIPKGSTIEDWPLTYEELEPYYDRVEYEIGVSGKAGNIGGKKDDRGNIFEGARKRDYPMPALRTTHNPEPTPQNSLTPQRDRRVHLRCATAGDPARRGGDEQEQYCHRGERQRIAHADAVELAGEPSRNAP